MTRATEDIEFLKLLQSYVPRNLFSAIQKNQNGNTFGNPYQQNLAAAGMFIDIAGFTPLSEKFQKLGKKGADQLTLTINSFFNEMIEIIQRYGGVVCSFGGDAMNVIFIYEDEANCPSTILATVACAVELQAYVQQCPEISTPDGKEKISIKVGLAHGPVFFTCSGQKDKMMRYLFSGPAIDTCGECEKHSERNEIVMHMASYSYVQKNLTGTVVEENFIKIDQASLALDQPLANLGNEPPLNHSDLKLIETLKTFVHRSIWEKLLVGGDNLIGEIRPVTTVFIKFTTLDFLRDTNARAKLNSFIEQLVGMLSVYNGYFSAIGAGDKGMTLLIFFGAPISFEKEEEAAVQFSLDLLSLKNLKKRDFWLPELQIGITTGSVFTGNVGSRRRREYTIIGDKINLAARLMVKTEPGEILIDSETAGKVKTRFDMTEIPNVKVKGKAEPLTIYKINKTKKKKKSKIPEIPDSLFVGREEVMAQLFALQPNIEAQRGLFLLIKGQSGIGKTTLTYKYAEHWQKIGGRVFEAVCSNTNRGKPLSAWLEIIAEFFGIDPDNPQEENYLELMIIINTYFPEYSDWGPYIGTLLNIVEDQQRVEDSLEKQRGFFEVFLKMLKTYSRHKQLLILIDDLQWIDEASLEFLGNVTHHLSDSRICIAATTRDDYEYKADLFGALNEFSIQPLSDKDTARLARVHCMQAEVPERLDVYIYAKSGGHPFYIAELINLLLSKKAIEIDEVGKRVVIQDEIEKIAMPNTVQDLIRTRFDTLDEGAKLILKVGAVKGTDVPLDVVRNLIPKSLVSGLGDTLKDLAAQKFIQLPPDNEDKFLFRPMLLQEIIYDSLLKEQLKDFHRRIAHYFEENAQPLSFPNKQEVAYHLYRGEDWDRAISYCHPIIEMLIESKKYEESFQYYDWYRKSADQVILEDVEKEKILCRNLSRCLVSILDTAIHLDQFKMRHAPRLFEYIAETEEMSNRLQIKLNRIKAKKLNGMLHGLKGDLPNAIASLEIGLAEARQFDQFEEMVLIQKELVRYLEKSRNWQQALVVLKEGELLVRSLNNPLISVFFFVTCGTAALYQGDYELANRLYNALLDNAKLAGNRFYQVQAIGNMGIVAHYTSKFDEAATLYERAYNLANKLGSQIEMARNLHNLGEVTYDKGDFKLALKYFSDGLEIADKAGWVMGYMANAIYVGFLKIKNNETDGDAFLHEGIKLAREYHFNQFIPLGMFYLGQSLIAKGQEDEGRVKLKEAFDHAAGIKYLKLCEDINKFNAEKGWPKLE